MRIEFLSGGYPSMEMTTPDLVAWGQGYGKLLTLELARDDDFRFFGRNELGEEVSLRKSQQATFYVTRKNAHPSIGRNPTRVARVGDRVKYLPVRDAKPCSIDNESRWGLNEDYGNAFVKLLRESPTYRILTVIVNEQFDVAKVSISWMGRGLRDLARAYGEVLFSEMGENSIGLAKGVSRFFVAQVCEDWRGHNFNDHVDVWVTKPELLSYFEVPQPDQLLVSTLNG